MDWRKFKETKIAVKCTSGKDKFFSDCAEHGIYNFMGERAMLRNYFVCRLIYLFKIRRKADFLCEK